MRKPKKPNKRKTKSQYPYAKKSKKSKKKRRHEELSKIIGVRCRANYGDKFYRKENEKGNRLIFTPKNSVTENI